uniref:Uncharacterized protein n=1 Tax=Solanum lycopersicum TaxID=4081 RepID=A0A3Q7IV85_SOLLC
MFREKGAALEIGVRTYMESLFNEYTKPVDFDKNGQFFSTEGGASSKSELFKYLDEEVDLGKSDFYVLIWWKVISPIFPIVS